MIGKNSSITFRNSSPLETENVSVSRKLEFPYEKKSRKIKKIQKTSLLKCRDSSLPHRYYPEIKSPLRRRLDEISKKFILKRRRSSRKRSRSRSKGATRNWSKSSTKRKSRSKSRSHSKSWSAKRKLDYSEEENKEYEGININVKPASRDSRFLSRTDERELAFFLRELQSLEHKLEIVKNYLAVEPDFNLLDAFAVFDKSGNGWIHYFDIIDELKKYSLTITSEEGRLFMQRYDKDKDQRLDFSEFWKAFTPILPKSSTLLQSKSYMSISDDHLNGFNAFSYNTKIKFLDAFKVHFEVERAVERWRQEVNKLYTLSPNNAFLHLGAKSLEGYIRANNLEKLFKKFDISLNEHELKMLVWRFTGDPKKTKISYENFVSELIPKSAILI